jgi:hypothetical protein
VKRRNFFKLGVVFITAGVMTGVGLIVVDGILPEAQVPPTVTPTALPDITVGVPLMLVVDDGQILFYDRPEGAAKPFHVEQGTILTVMVLEERREQGTEWFFLQLTEIEGRGWVRADEMMVIRVDPILTFDQFQFCLGSDASPSGPCGTSLPLSDSEVWLTYHFKGLKRGAILQTMVVVEGEQYHSKPQTWNGASSGTQLVNLVNAHHLPATPGLWTVKFYVDDQFVTETSVQIRP